MELSPRQFAKVTSMEEFRARRFTERGPAEAMSDHDLAAHVEREHGQPLEFTAVRPFMDYLHKTLHVSADHAPWIEHKHR